MTKEKLAKDITKKLESIQLSNKEIAARIGISASDMSNAKNPKNKVAISKLNGILKDLVKLEMECRKHPDECKKNTGSKNKPLSVIATLSGTTWGLYFYHKYGNEEGVARAVLSFQNDKLFGIKNIEGEDQTDYVGTDFFSYRNDQYLFFDFKTTDRLEKWLRIVVIRGEGKAYPLMAGVFSNINSKGALVTGTVILQNETKNKHKLKPNFFHHQKKQTSGDTISTAIQLFLKEKHLNSLKVTIGLNSEEQLFDFLKQKGKRAQEADQAVDLFISAPMTGLNEDAFDDLKEKIKKIKDAAQKGYGFKTVYFAGDTVKKISLPNAADKALTNATEHLNRSTSLLLFVDRPVQSSSFVEIGYALAEIPCTIFTPSKNFLPYMLRQDTKNEFVKNLKVYEYPNFDVLLAMLSEQKYTL